MHRCASIVLILALAASGCSYPPRLMRTLVPPEGAGTLDRKAPYLKAHLQDGGVYVLSHWTVDEGGGSVTGGGELLGPDRRLRRQGLFTVPITSVALFETNVVTDSASLRDRSLMMGISAAVTVGCLVAPKACFGSCPTFYAGEGDSARLSAEGFSTSIAPSLEATDLDALYLARARGRRFELRLTNEALETHVIRHAHLLSAPRPRGGRVVATREGELHSVTDLREPATCAAEEGDCRAAVLALDGRERTSRTDGRDLAAGEVVELTFESPPDGPLGLVVGARQTLLTTFLFYQTLAYMGPSAGEWLARLERQGPGSPVVDRVHALRDILRGIDVMVSDGQGGWASAGEVYETGPLASDVKVVPLPPRHSGSSGVIDSHTAVTLRVPPVCAGGDCGAGHGPGSSSPPDPLRVRLTNTRGNVRLDFVALGRLGDRVTPRRLAPVEVRREGGGRVEAFLRRPLTTLPGDAYRLVYQLPPDPEAQELFLESRGYYLEWMRQEWLADADPAAVLRVLADPRRTLRDLAPAYHRQEDEMERAFWSSRYGGPGGRGAGPCSAPQSPRHARATSEGWRPCVN